MGIYRSQNAFIGGEISPKLHGRVDLASYKNSVALLENFLILPHGGVTARPGTKYAWTVKDSTQNVRLLPFEVSQDTSYVIEMGVGYFRFGSYGARIAPGTLAAYNSGTTYAHGDQVSSGGVNYYSILDTNLNHTPASSATYWYPMPAGIFEIPHDYTSGELADVMYCQSVDVMWLFHPNHPVKRLERYGDADWLFVPEVLLDGPYDGINYTTTTLTPSGATGSVTVTASSVAGINDGQGFLATDVGRHVRIFGTAWAWGQITARASATSVTVLVVEGSFPTSAKTLWRLGRYSATTGYPSVGALVDARLVICGDENIDLSRTDLLADYGVSETVDASDACSFKMLSNQANPIRWVISARGGIAVGTLSGEFLMTGGTQDAAITPSSISAKQHTSIGSVYQQAVAADAVMLFISRTRREIHEFAFVYEDDGYQAPNLSLLSEHLFRNNTIVTMDYQRSSSILWCIRDDGVALGLTYKRKEQVVGWHHHTTQGRFLDVVCVNEGERDTPYFIVSRTVGGVTTKFVEYLAADFTSGALVDAYYVDGGVQVALGAGTEVSGLGHIEGLTVSILADGKVVARQVVTGGKITLPYEANKISVGLSYYSDLQTLPIEEPGINDGATLGRVKTISGVILKLYESYGALVGPDVDHLDTMIFNEGQVFGEAPDPFSGDKSIMLYGGHASDKRIYIRRDIPLPLTVSVIVADWEVTQR